MLIRQSGITYQEIAAELSLSISAVMSWLTKGKIPRGDTLVQLARLLGTKAEELFEESHIVAPGVRFELSADMPEVIRREVIAFARTANRKYRESVARRPAAEIHAHPHRRHLTAR